MRTFAFALCLAGCLGEATVVTNDLSASVFDLSEPPSIADLAGLEAGAKLSNCVQLNDCEKACANDPKPQMCVANCRALASTSAVMKEMALQNCFGQYCPQATDAGTGAVCTRTDMGFSTACTTCIADSQVAPANMCVNPANPECHQCYDEAIACLNDK